jgi:aryl-alcohol dehydrogenase-like predicted oxidoreductase
MHSGFATSQGTSHYTDRFPAARQADFFRLAQGCSVSSLGIGTYMGPMDAETDRSYTQAVLTAIRGGINFVDTSLNYRNQRSERNIGAALDQAFAEGFPRDELVVCTKAGFLVPDALPKGVLKADDVVGNMHSMAPAFLAEQLERSRANLGLETIDVLYLHNPETQLQFVSEGEFYSRAAVAFEQLETLVQQKKIRYYGTATWDGYRKRSGGLSLVRLLEVADQLAGAGHHFRFIQLPFNLGMVEAFSLRNQRMDGVERNVLEVAQASDVTVVASASLSQARLTKNVPQAVAERLPGPTCDAQLALQFTRSTPGIAVALAGMSKAVHVTENLGVSAFPPATVEQYQSLFARAN